MDKKAQLTAMIDAIINNKPEEAKAAFAPYVQEKVRQVLGYSTPPAQAVTEGAKITALREWIEAQSDSPVKLQGDKVFVNGKQVGFVQTDATDFDSGINFIEAGNKFSKEFDTVEDLFGFLVHRYTKEGAAQ